MTGKQLKDLREKGELTQLDMAKILGISPRTLAKWESEGDNIFPVYVNAFRTILENLILAPILKKSVEGVFKEIPSEFVGIWLVRYSLFPIQYVEGELGKMSSHASYWEVILHENTARYQCLCDTNAELDGCYWKFYCNNEDHCYHNDRIHKTMGQKSQTTYPLCSGETINLAGDDIVTSPYKRIAGRVNPLFHDQMCHSLLHVPYHIPGLTGPQPIALLSLENKLQRNGDDPWKVQEFPQGCSGKIAYADKDEQTAKNLLKKIFEEDLKDIIEALDYFPS